MALTNKQKQTAFRARKLAAGKVELRGIYVDKCKNNMFIKNVISEFIDELEDIELFKEQAS